MCAYSADLNFRLAAPHTAATSLPMATFKNVSASACMQSSQLAFLPAVNLMCCFIVFMPLQHTPMQSLRLIKVKTSLLPPFFFLQASAVWRTFCYPHSNMTFAAMERLHLRGTRSGLLIFFFFFTLWPHARLSSRV